MKYLIFSIICLTLVACGNPYENKVEGKITPSQAEKLANKLPEKDRDIFLRWHKRDAIGEKFGGEGSIRTVKDAINTQVEYEARKARDFERQAELRAEEEKIARAKQADIEARRQKIQSYAEHRHRVHEHISEAVTSKAINYRLDTQFDSYNRPIGRTWVFNIEVKNNTQKEVIGLAGYLTIKDAFGVDLGTYPFTFETNLAPGKTSIQSLWMNDNPNDQKLRRLKEAKTIFPEWFLESLAFKDGSRIDEKSIPQNENIPARKVSQLRP